MNTVSHQYLVQISLQDFHNTARGILKFNASRSEIDVIIHPRFYQVFLSLWYLVIFSGVNSIESSPSTKFWLSFEVLQNSFFSQFSLNPAKYQFCINVFYYSFSVRMSFTGFFSLN